MSTPLIAWGNMALIQVRVQGFTNLTYLQFTLQWDPAVFEYVNVLSILGYRADRRQLYQRQLRPVDHGVGPMPAAAPNAGDGSLLFNPT